MKQRDSNTSVLDRLAGMQGVRGSDPDKELARELADAKDAEGIKVIAENLHNRDKRIQSDCIKVLYEAGYIDPEIIAPYVKDFLSLLKSRNNRLVWGAMIALAQVASLKAGEVFESIDAIYAAMEEGTVITVDNGIRVLSAVASKSRDYSESIFPYLIKHLQTCRPKEAGQHTESIFTAVNPANREAFLSVIEERQDDLTDAQRKRVKKLRDTALKLK